MADAAASDAKSNRPASRAPAWEHFPHDADVGVRGFGASLEEAFIAAAEALSATVTDPACITPSERVEIACEAPDHETLFLDWLNAVIFEMATRSMLFSRFEAVITEGRLTGAAWGEPVDAVKHRPAVEPKGATWTELSVSQGADGRWQAQCIVDV